MHLNNKQFQVALFFDLSRAFDTVNHNLLLEKLYRIGIRGVVNDWVASYLKNRSQIVVIDFVKSRPASVSMGVPQGSTLAPLFFIIFMSDIELSSVVQQKTIIYADDTSKIVAQNKLPLSIKTANSAAEEFARWCENSGLAINISKTVFMVFQQKNISYDYCPLIRVNNKSIEQVNMFKYLGLTIDQKLIWEAHIENLVTKMSCMCFVIKQIRGTVSLHVLKLIYYGLVQSILSYGLPFWGNSVHTIKVFKQQKKVIRCLAGLHYKESCKSTFTELTILTLPSLYIYIITMNVKKMKHTTPKII